MGLFNIIDLNQVSLYMSDNVIAKSTWLRLTTEALETLPVYCGADGSVDVLELPMWLEIELASGLKLAAVEPAGSVRPLLDVSEVEQVHGISAVLVVLGMLLLDVHKVIWLEGAGLVVHMIVSEDVAEGDKVIDVDAMEVEPIDVDENWLVVFEVTKEYVSGVFEAVCVVLLLEVKMDAHVDQVPHSIHVVDVEVDSVAATGVA